MSRLPRRPPSSGTWAGLSPEARADLYASDRVSDFLDALTATDMRVERSVALAALRDAYLAGTERERNLMTSVGLLQEQVARMSRRMSAAGLDPMGPA